MTIECVRIKEESLWSNQRAIKIEMGVGEVGGEEP